MKKQAFTLVELIVVITILAILGTIGFLSFQGYSRDARDSTRISDLSNIAKSMELMLTKTGRLPIPDDGVEITASGTTISYQGFAGENVLSAIGVNNGGKDPKDNTYYTYVSNAQYNKYQLLGFLENGDLVSKNNIHQAHANLSDRFIISKGSELGVLLDVDSYEPIELNNLSTLDIFNTPDTYIVQTDENSSFQGTGSTISKKLSYRVNKKGSCLALLKNEQTYGDGLYEIDPLGDENYIKVYCDMTTDGGGWTLLSTAIGETTSVFDYNDIISWTPRNSDNCGVDTECLSQSGLYMDIWDELMVYTRGYRVKGVGCNDKNETIYSYSQLPKLSTVWLNANWFDLNYGAHGKCDQEYEVSEGKIVSDLSTHYDPWEIHMGVQMKGNEGGSQPESSLLFFGPTFIPQGLGNQRNGNPGKKIYNFYPLDTSYQLNPWDGASTQKQVWFIR